MNRVLGLKLALPVTCHEIEATFVGEVVSHVRASLFHVPLRVQKGEGISLNQYIIYTLTQKVTAEKLAGEGKSLSSEQAIFLANVELVPPEQVAKQRTAFEALLSRLSPEATDEEVEQHLSEREAVEPESELEAEAVMRLKERIAHVKQAA